MKMTAGFIRLVRRQPVITKDGDGDKPRRAVGFAPWPAVLEWEVVWDTETFADQEDRLREVLAFPDDEEPLAM